MKANIYELRLDFVELQAHPEKYDIVIVGATKKCTQCDEIKVLNEFNKNKTSKDGYISYCRVCQNNSEKEWYENNKDKKNKKIKEWYENNKEQQKKQQKEYRKNNKEQKKEYQKEYYKNNKEQINEHQKEYEKNRRETDPLFKLTKNIRNSTIKTLKNKGFTKKNRTAEILGCSFEEFQEHIGKQMSRWMNWENHGLYNGELNFGWDIDHIIPLSSAKTEEELLKLCHYSNLQPLCSHVNRDIKKDKLDFYNLFGKH